MTEDVRTGGMSAGPVERAVYVAPGKGQGRFFDRSGCGAEAGDRATTSRKAEASFGNRSCARVRRSIPSLSRSLCFEVRSRRRWPTGIEEIASDSGPLTSCHSASLGASS